MGVSGRRVFAFNPPVIYLCIYGETDVFARGRAAHTVTEQRASGAGGADAEGGAASACCERSSRAVQLVQSYMLNRPCPPLASVW